MDVIHFHPTETPDEFCWSYRIKSPNSVYTTEILTGILFHWKHEQVSIQKLSPVGVSHKSPVGGASFERLQQNLAGACLEWKLTWVPKKEDGTHQDLSNRQDC